MPTTSPYGSWKSPITADRIVSGTIGLGQIALDGEDIYWVEMRPSEGGRMVVVKRDSAGEVIDITPEHIFKSTVFPTLGWETAAYRN